MTADEAKKLATDYLKVACQLDTMFVLDRFIFKTEPYTKEIKLQYNGHNYQAHLDFSHKLLVGSRDSFLDMLDGLMESVIRNTLTETADVGVKLFRVKYRPQIRNALDESEAVMRWFEVMVQQEIYNRELDTKCFRRVDMGAETRIEYHDSSGMLHKHFAFSVVQVQNLYRSGSALTQPEWLAFCKWMDELKTEVDALNLGIGGAASDNDMDAMLNRWDQQ